MQKTCNRCCTTKEESLFKRDYKYKGVVRYTTICKLCEKDSARKYRQDNRQIYNQRARIQRKEKKLLCIEYFGGKCSDCGQSVHPAAFDFHHTDPTEKETDVGLLFNLSMKRLMTELDKCILLCSNCHRVRHYIEDH